VVLGLFVLLLSGFLLAAATSEAERAAQAKELQWLRVQDVSQRLPRVTACWCHFQLQCLFVVPVAGSLQLHCARSRAHVTVLLHVLVGTNVLCGWLSDHDPRSGDCSARSNRLKPAQQPGKSSPSCLPIALGLRRPSLRSPGPLASLCYSLSSYVEAYTVSLWLL
jgi:hypothetical protein